MKYGRTVFATLCVLLFARSALANVPIFPVSLLTGFTLMTVIRTAGLSLLAVVLIEAPVLRRYESISILEALKLSAMANGFSTLIGGGIAATYSSSFLLLIGLLVGSPLIAAMIKDVTTRSEINLKFTKRAWLVVPFCFALGVLAFFLAALTIPGQPFLHPAMNFQSTAQAWIASLAAVILLILGFFLSVISEAFILFRFISGQPKAQWKPVVIMNIVSYAVLISASAIFLRTVIADRLWYWRPL